MNVNESAAASTKVVGAAAKVSRVLSWMLSNGTNTDMTVSEIAYEVGFNDPKYFTRCFAKEFGATPSEMQKKG